MFPSLFRAFDANGAPLAGGKLYSYENGTSTPKNTFTDQGAGTPNANPTILDANGEAAVWLSETGGYKLDLYDSSDVQQDGWPIDEVYENQGSASALDIQMSDNTGSAFQVRQSTNKYINIDTTNSSENIDFGNTGTNPSFNFLGSGNVIIDSDLTLSVASNNVTIENNNNSTGTLTFSTGSGSMIFKTYSATLMTLDSQDVVVQGGGTYGLYLDSGKTSGKLLDDGTNLTISNTTGSIIFAPGDTTDLTIGDNLITIASGTTLKVGNAFQAGDPTTTGYILLSDSAGVSYKIPAEAA